MSLSAFFNSLDLFKQPLSLRISHQEKTSTNFGIFISVIIYVFLGYSFSQNDFFKRLNPLIIFQTLTISHPPNIKYQGNPFAFSVKDNLGNIYTDQTYFNITAQEFQGITLSNGTFIPITTEKKFHICEENEVKRSEDWLNFNNNYCLDDSSFELEGEEGENLVKNFEIHLNVCQNKTDSNITCKSPDEINAFFNLKHLSLTFMDNYFEAKNYENPIVSKSSIKKYKVGSELNTLVTISFQKSEIITDETNFFNFNPQNEIKETYLFEKEKIEYGMSSLNFMPIASFLIYSSDNVLIINRSYQKLSDALAVLGGLLSCFMVVGRILSQIDKTLHMTIVLMNYLYSFQQPNNPYSDKSPIKKQNSSLFFHHSPNPNDIELKVNKQEHNNEKEKQENEMNENIEINSFKEFEMNSKLKTSQRHLLSPENNNKSHVEIEKLKEKILLDESFMSQRFSKENSPKKNKKKNSDPLVNRNVAMSPTCQELKTHKKEKTPLKINNNPRRKSIFGGSILSASNNLDPEKKTLEEFLKFRDQKNRIVFTIFDYVKYCSKKIFGMANNLKEKLFIRAREIFEHEIDIVKILQRVQDIEKLKYLLLNENQIALFNILEKPMIYVDENRNPHRSSMSLVFGPKKIKTQIQVQQAFDYYQELEKGKEMDPIDKKLFNMVDKRFKTFQKYFVTE